MAEFPIAGPTDAVVQIAYGVPDLQAAITWWVEQLGVGPWFVWDRAGGEGGRYRGQPSAAEFAIALAYSGPMMYELVQTLDDKPSVYKEARERNGYGFHHLAKMRPNVKQLAADCQANGQAIAFQAPVPGGEVFMIDTGPGAPGFLELIEDSDATRKTFEVMWRAARDWKGERPVRTFAELMDAVQAG